MLTDPVGQDFGKGRDGKGEGVGEGFSLIHNAGGLNWVIQRLVAAGTLGAGMQEGCSLMVMISS